MSAPRFSIVVITDHLPDVPERVARALASVPPLRVAVQLRMKQANARDQLSIARELRSITREAGAFLFINDRVDVALAADADGVHLPAAGLGPADVRELMPRGCIGLSCHSARDLAAAAVAGADYATLSPIYAVEGKAPPLGIAGFGAAIAGAALPVYALGGVGPRDLPALLACGARGVAVIRAVMSADEPGRALSDLLTRIDHARPQEGGEALPGGA